MDLQFARYYQKANEPVQALQWAQKALTVNGTSIPAQVIIGEGKEKQGDPQGARAAYQAALAEFYRQNPKSYEEPLYLIYKTANLSFAKTRS